RSHLLRGWNRHHLRPPSRRRQSKRLRLRVRGLKKKKRVCDCAVPCAQCSTIVTRTTRQRRRPLGSWYFRSCSPPVGLDDVSGAEHIPSTLKRALSTPFVHPFAFRCLVPRRRGRNAARRCGKTPHVTVAKCHTSSWQNATRRCGKTPRFFARGAFLKRPQSQQTVINVSRTLPQVVVEKTPRFFARGAFVEPPQSQ